jgi:hypothetical protein
VPSNSMYASNIFVKSFYTDLHDKRTDSLVPAIMGGWAVASHLRPSFLLNNLGFFFAGGGGEEGYLFVLRSTQKT